MRRLEPTTRFARDYARRIQGTPLETEFAVLASLLQAGQPLPPRYRDHPLKGNWIGHRDRHLRGDMVAIYQVLGQSVVLRRIGTHTDLFG